MYDHLTDPLTAIEKMGEWIASSGMLGCTKVEQGKLIAWQCAAERKTPFDFKREYHIINGSLSMRSDAMLAGYRARGGKVFWKQFDSKAAVAVWKYDGNECEIGFTESDAKIAGLLPAKPGSGWAKDPSAMLRARCISKAIRMLAPEVVAGIYTPEETEDFTPAPCSGWAKDPSAMLRARCISKAIRMLAPEVVAGIYTPEETEDFTPAPSEVAVTPSPSFDLVTKLETLFESREIEVNALLIKAGRLKDGQTFGRLKDGQTFRDLDDVTAARYIKKPDLILSKLVTVEPPIATEVSNA